MKYHAASEEGDFSVTYGEGTMRDRPINKSLCKRCGTLTVVGLIIMEMSREGAAGTKTLAEVIFVIAHCPVYLHCRVSIKEQ